MLLLDRVARSFGSVHAVQSVSFSVAGGSVFGLLGPNGAGKTTTMRMILGIYPPDSGTIAWKGQRINARLRRRFGYLPEERGLYGRMRVREQIIYFARLHGLALGDAERRTDRWIEGLSLGEYATRNCSELSKGNQQKVQMACAAVHDPELLILDEPFSGLDPINAEALLDAMKGLVASGTTLLLSTHQMWQIERICSEFCIIAEGRVRAQGTLVQLRGAFPTRTVRVVPDTPAIRAVFDAAGALLQPSENDGVLYSLPADADFGALLRGAVAAGPVTTFERAEPSLTEIYLHALDGASRDAVAA
ncbi:MAG: ATP-binding cassette domain-containing protein [Candidatus Eremiobacteraeota bacterium]|nr:ATP-binding cassette domain-containing protein [Candidatus Eremiobacteraeota bacterium]